MSAVILQLNTFEGPSAVAKATVPLLDEAKARLLAPHFDLRDQDLRSGQMESSVFEESSEFGEPGGHWIKLAAGPTMEATSMYRFTQDHWRELLECVSAGDCGYFELTVYPLDESGYPDYGRGGCTLSLSLQEPQYPRAPHRLHLAVDRSVFREDGFASDQDEWCSFAKATAVQLRAAYGYMTLDNAGPDETPYEKRWHIYWYEGAATSASKVRGYYWGNFLSEGHIDQLGGMDEMLTSAPCFLVEDLTENGRKLAYLQLTASLDEFSDAQLLKLKEYLGPLLSSGHTARYLGAPLRVLDS